ncbi:glycosyltransferase [Spirosoma aerophilum]
MKIAISADWLYPAQMGGSANSIYWLAKALTNAGHEVTVVGTSQDLPPSVPVNRWLELDFGRVVYSRNPHFYLPVSHIWYGWQAIRQAEVVHVNSLFYPASFVWVLLCRLLGKPVVWSPHGELSPVALLIRPRLKRFLLSIFRWYRSGVVFHATCAEEMRQIQQHFGEDARVCAIRTMMELPGQRARVAQPYLLFVGRMHPIKGVDRLLMALSGSTVFLMSPYYLVIAGPDSDKAYAQTLQDMATRLGLSDKVRFVGSVEGELKQLLYADAHLLILPSHSENFGNVVIESLAQGTPVIASTHTPWQVLHEERAGRWVSNDPESLRQAIEPFIGMPASAYDQYRIRALRLARRDYDITTNSAVWTDLYEAASQQTYP